MDLKEYNNLEEVVGYDGFITKQGTFYKVRSSNDLSNENTHEKFAYNFLKEINDFKVTNNDFKLFDEIGVKHFYQKAIIKLLVEYEFFPYANYVTIYKDVNNASSEVDFASHEQRIAYEELVSLNRIKEDLWKKK